MTDRSPDSSSKLPIEQKAGDLSASDIAQRDGIPQIVQSQSVFVGPLPHPDMLRQYDDIVPGAGERILAMTENEGEHRRSLEAKLLAAESRLSLLGVVSAFVLGLCTIVGGIVCILKGQPFGGTFLGSAGLAGLVWAFISGTRQRATQRGDASGDVPD